MNFHIVAQEIMMEYEASFNYKLSRGAKDASFFHD